MFLEILFDILSFSATTWQFFVTLSDSLRCVLYWDHLMIPPKILLLDEVFLAVQNSSIGDLVTDSLTHSLRTLLNVTRISQGFLKDFSRISLGFL